MNVQDFVRTTAQHLEPRTILQSTPAVLLGVSEASATALRTLDIRTVFDLGTSRVFVNAAALAATRAGEPSVFSRFGAVTSDVIDASARPLTVEDLGAQPIEVLDGIGSENGVRIREALSVATVRDLGLWPPFRAAAALLKQVLVPEELEEFDPEAPRDLVPRNGDYPTEKVFYRTVVIDEIEGAATEDLDSPVDVAALGDMTGFQKPATGAIVTMEQAWYAQGVTLGNLLHSVALAPGESTRIALIDWSRRTTGRTDEDVAQTEALASETSHRRAISEVTSAVAREAQQGFSRSTAQSESQQYGSAFGIFGGIDAYADQYNEASSGTQAETVTGSSGQRDLFASMTQNASDSTQQFANSARNRRASIVQEVTQTEKEQITTRTITNYNHMHALSVQYYEVVQIYRVSTTVARVDKCLFVPMKIIDAWTPDLVDRYRHLLLRALPAGPLRRALQQGVDLVKVAYPYGDVVHGETAQKRAEELGKAREVTGHDVAAGPEAIPWTLPPSTRLTEIKIAGNGLLYVADRIALWRRDGSSQVFTDQSEVVIEPGADLSTLDRMTVRFSLPQYVEDDGSGYSVPQDLPVYANIVADSAARVTFTFHHDDATFKRTMMNRGGPNLASLVRTERRTDLDHENFRGFMLTVELTLVEFEAGGLSVAEDVIQHLRAHAARYSQVIWMGMDSATLSLALARYRYDGRPLLQQISPVPVAVTGNYVGFRMNVDRADKAWLTWLDEHGLNAADIARHETVPLPSGGVFGEAVLGRFNSAEKLDLSRFWNWKDSPIPFAAPEIAAIQAGSRRDGTAPQPGHLDPPLIAQTPASTLPDPQGLTAIITALAAANMFRDMSGSAQTASLAQAALQASAQGATAVGQQAGANLATTAQTGLEFMKAYMQTLTTLYGQALGAAGMGAGLGGLGGGTGGLGSLGSTISGIGAVLNAATALDKRTEGARGAGGGGGAGSGGSRTNGNGTPAGQTPAGGPRAALAPRTVYEDTFRRLTDPGGDLRTAFDAAFTAAVDAAGRTSTNGTSAPWSENGGRVADGFTPTMPALYGATEQELLQPSLSLVSSYFSQYEADTRVPERANQLFRFGIVQSLGQQLRHLHVDHRLRTMRAADREWLFDRAKELCDDDFLALLLCHNHARAMGKREGGLTYEHMALPWDKLAGDADKVVYRYRVFDDLSNATFLDVQGVEFARGAAPDAVYYLTVKQTRVPSAFYLLFDPATPLGTADPNDWYHYFLAQAVTYLFASGRVHPESSFDTGSWTAYSIGLRYALEWVAGLLRNAQPDADQDDPRFAGWVWMNALSFLEGIGYGKVSSQADSTRESHNHRAGALAGIERVAPLGAATGWRWFVPRAFGLVHEVGRILDEAAQGDLSAAWKVVELLEPLADSIHPYTYEIVDPHGAPVSPFALTVGAHVPEAGEEAACGPFTGSITRDSAAFLELVVNDNEEIIFKDEEGTTADRLMTPRLKQCLDRLAGYVRTEFPGRRLRVTEAWDEDAEHSVRSLHYEGRAADLTIDDRDGEKLGRLAQLAVYAGADWTFYEAAGSAGHVHASVKKDE